MSNIMFSSHSQSTHSVHLTHSMDNNVDIGLNVSADMLVEVPRIHFSFGSSAKPSFGNITKKQTGNLPPWLQPTDIISRNPIPQSVNPLETSSKIQLGGLSVGIHSVTQLGGIRDKMLKDKIVQQYNGLHEHCLSKYQMLRDNHVDPTEEQIRDYQRSLEYDNMYQSQLKQRAKYDYHTQQALLNIHHQNQFNDQVDKWYLNNQPTQ